MEKRIIRNYCEEDDLDAIIELYEFKRLLFERDETHFQHFLKFPGVQGDGIFVSLENGSLDGIMIISILEDKRREILVGSVIELFTISIPSMESLVQEAEAYCIDKCADVIYLNPTVDVSMSYIFGNWIKYNTNGVIMAKPLYILPIIKCLLNLDILSNFYSNKKLLFIFDEEKIRVHVDGDSLDISYQDEKLENYDVYIFMESKTFLGIIFGSINPYIAWLTNRVRISRVRDTFVILRFLSILKIDVYGRIAIGDSV